MFQKEVRVSAALELCNPGWVTFAMGPESVFRVVSEGAVGSVLHFANGLWVRLASERL
jgi:hypothetical protein